MNAYLKFANTAEEKIAALKKENAALKERPEKASWEQELIDRGAELANANLIEQQAARIEALKEEIDLMKEEIDEFYDAHTGQP